MVEPRGLPLRRCVAPVKPERRADSDDQGSEASSATHLTAFFPPHLLQCIAGKLLDSCFG